MSDNEFGLIMRRLEDLKTGQERILNRLARIETALGVALKVETPVIHSPTDPLPRRGPGRAAKNHDT